MNNNSIQKNKFFKKYLKYKKKYLDLKIFKFGGNNNINQTSLRKAKELNYQTNQNLYLIIGTSNDNRFDQFQGFTVNNKIETGEEYNLTNNKMFPLIYDATSIFFFNAINEYSFNNIIIDYNVLPFISYGVINIINRLKDKLIRNGKLYFPINISPYLRTNISNEKEMEKKGIEVNNEKRTYTVKSPNFFKDYYRVFGKDGRMLNDVTDYNTYLQNSIDLITDKINLQGYEIEFFINSLAYKQKPYPTTPILQFRDYPIPPRIYEFNFIESISEFAIITKIN
jgi:hypothetical protein